MKNNLSLHEKQLISYLESSENILGAAWKKKPATGKKREKQNKNRKKSDIMQSHSTAAGFVSYYMFSTVLTNLIVSVPEQGFLHFPGKTI